MSNPFSAQFESRCNLCDERIEEGEDVFATDEGFICQDCAENSNYVCECGNFKKPEYETCYKCKFT